MGKEVETHFKVDKSKCTKCYRCINSCSGMVLQVGEDGYPEMKSFSRYGWSGCWRCQHCLAVCPEGAITIFDKDPDDSAERPPEEMGDYMDRLVKNRRACRRYKDENVDPKIIDDIMSSMDAVPAGGNSRGCQYTVIDDKARTKQIHDVAYKDMEREAKKGHYTTTFNKSTYKTMKKSEGSIRKGDMLFDDAPHLFIAHAKDGGKWSEDNRADCNIATAYFELLANAHGLGTVIMSYPAEVIEEMSPKAREMLGIPKDHYMHLIVGFGYPEYEYARGVQKDGWRKTYRFTKEKNKKKKRNQRRRNGR